MPNHTEPTGIGIGRPTSPEWNNSFTEAFNYVAPSGLWLKMRDIPGVIYVSDTELDTLQGNNCPNTSDKAVVLRRVEAFAGALCAENVLTREAYDTTTVKIDDVRIDNRPNPNVLRIRARVRDIPFAMYPERYLIIGEKQTIRETLGLSNPNRTPKTGIVRTYLNLGTIHGDLSLITHDLQRETKRLVNKKAELLPVGPVQS